LKIIIIGSKGFIGSHLLEYYRTNKENEVWAADVLVDYEDQKYFLIDASNSDFYDLFKSQEFNVCINCSGAANVPDSLKNPQRDFYLNTLNVFNILESIRKNQPFCKFLNLSSAAVYGNPLSLPIKEDAVLMPLSPYGFHKRNAEVICEEFNRFYDIKTCNIRIFSAYGNGLKKQLFWDLAQKAAKSKTLTLLGTGKESRDFIHIDDILQTINLIINKGVFENEYYNVANGVEIDIEVAANTLLNAMNWKGKLNFNQEKREGDPLNWCADISKLKNLGYKQSISIYHGLKQYALWLEG
jgi:UDP-glucose 4-epimerase